MIQKGFNSDISVKGKTFHVQTEDWGAANPFIVSRVFYNGAVVKSIKTPYELVIGRGPVQTSESVKLALRSQHHEILDQLISGQLVVS
jgi:hypothetical protein